MMKQKCLRKFYNYCNEYYAQKKMLTNIDQFELLKKYCTNKQRCFVIGNGPSLISDDLDLLKNEITFVCNRFFNIYDSWIPTVYFCQDPTVMKNNVNQIKAYSAKFKMINPHLRLRRKMDFGDNCIFYRVNRKKCFKGETPDISNDMKDGLDEGYTVTFSMIQTAILLGFQEIYLLGVDFNYVIKDGRIDESSYPKGMEKTAGGGLPNLQYNLKAFEIASLYCKNHGVDIINLSRNTKLDVFPKGILKEILSEKEE